jgi:hypothetical protein
MNIIVGGGKYGCEAVEYLRKQKRSFVLVDIDPNCQANKKYKLKPTPNLNKDGEHFQQGDIATVLQLIEQLEPEYVFPTAPIHIAAELAKTKLTLEPWNEPINNILANLPPSVILRAGKGNLIVSYNRDENCIQKCEAPETCPATGIRKPCTMDKLMRFAYPNAIFLTSHQMAPGMGAFKTTELTQFLNKAAKQEKFVVATTCNCHGYFTALKKKPQHSKKQPTSHS